MNWDAIGAIAEVLGAVAVLATIIYLAIQVRGAREELRHSIEQNTESTNLTLTLEPLRNPQLHAATSKAVASSGKVLAAREALKTLGDFTEDELSLLHTYYFAWWLNYSGAIANINYLSSTRRQALEARLRFHYGSGPHKVWFDGYREGLARDDPAIEFVAKLLAEDT